MQKCGLFLKLTMKLIHMKKLLQLFKPKQPDPPNPHQAAEILGLSPSTVQIARMIEQIGSDEWAATAVGYAPEELNEYDRWRSLSTEEKLQELLSEEVPTSIKQFANFVVAYYNVNMSEFEKIKQKSSWKSNLNDLYNLISAIKADLEQDNTLKKEYQHKFYNVAVLAYLAAYSLLYGRQSKNT